MKFLVATLLAAVLTGSAIAPGGAQDPSGPAVRHQLQFHGADLHDAITLIGDEYGVRMIADGSVPHVKIPDNMPPLTLSEMLERLDSFGLDYRVTQDASGQNLYTFSAVDDVNREYGKVYDRTLKYQTPDEQFQQWLKDSLPVGTRILVNASTRRVLVVGTDAALSRAKILLDDADVSSVAQPGDPSSADSAYMITQPIYVHNVLPTVLQKELSQASSAGGGTSASAIADVTTAGSNSGGTLIPDDKAMVIVASGSRDFIAQTKQRVQYLDVPTVQGKFDVEILAITKTGSLQFGNQFGGVGASTATSTTTGTATSTGTGTFTLGSTTTSFVGRAIPISMTINALIDNGDAKVLSKSTITAANSQVTHLKSGERYPFPITDPVTGLVSYQTENIGVILDITPVFGDTSTAVTMHLEDSDLTGQVNGAYPIISENIYDNAGGFIRMNYDETWVLGGLMKTTSDTDIQRVPWLSDIPIIGGLFKFKNETKQDVQLMFMLTPHRDDTK